MKVDLLIGEIGSTTTVVNAFNLYEPEFLGQGQAITSIEQGDVTLGLNEAVKNLSKKLGQEKIDYNQFMATSSAAGGLKMTVHGLVYDMTVKAAREAALGAGANIKMVTAGRLKERDLQEIKELRPNIIMIAGGVDYGESDTALYNSQKIANLSLDIPIIYAGNKIIDQQVREIFQSVGQEIYVVENVYPKIDSLNIEPSRRIIQEVFERHIVHAEGMDKIDQFVKGPIMPTPGAVMEASMLLYEDMGNLLTIDIGGATTDVHSVCQESDQIASLLVSPEPLAKRTVEGDLGLYINKDNLLKLLAIDKLADMTGLKINDLERAFDNYDPIGQGQIQEKIRRSFCQLSSKLALERHVGRIDYIYGPKGRRTIAQGKDLSAVKYIIGTGGGLTRLEAAEEILRASLINKGNLLLPKEDTRILIDKNYIMASLGLMSRLYPEQALKLLKESLKGGD